MSLTDAHAHLSDDAFCEDIDAILHRAKNAGISLIVNVASTVEELKRSFSYAERFPDIHFSHVGGTPPQDAQKDIEEDFRYIRELASHGKLAAIGEVGLDYGFANTSETSRRQHQVLRRYLALALECKLPLVVHCRGAFQDFFHALDSCYSKYPQACPGMLHCFTGSIEEAQELIARGWFLSISGIVTFKNAQYLRDLVLEIPLDHLLIETDAPFLAPTPFRGKKNEPAYIVHTVETIAAIKGCSVEELSSIVRNNTLRFCNTKNF
ncbi:TatD family hydrolase [Chlamydia sp. 17-3921]|uniref:TatD family hydrolase n=1 Tax=Chlamydia sp. 17-3921 TaxID=2675798 RepID=UPI00191B4280|nr:TatD family hydrolase [Chlamydia sp. 17-3921]